MGILGWYEFFCKIPFIGRWLFGLAVSFSSPYTGSLPFYVQSLNGQGHCTLSLRDSWFIRNPFSCIHAAALTNLGEGAGGLAVLCLLESQKDQKLRGIVSRLESVFYKKAQGRIVAIVDIPPESMTSFAPGEITKEIPVKALLSDATGTVVASVTAQWSVRRSEPKSTKSLKSQ
jgi:hypothetical protein